MAKGHIVVDSERCKGCELCLAACPQKVIGFSSSLNSRGYRPITYHDSSAACTGCALCAVVCPEACITVYREKAARRKPALMAQAV